MVWVADDFLIKNKYNIDEYYTFFYSLYIILSKINTNNHKFETFQKYYIELKLELFQNIYYNCWFIQYIVSVSS